VTDGEVGNLVERLKGKELVWVGRLIEPWQAKLGSAVVYALSMTAFTFLMELLRRLRRDHRRDRDPAARRRPRCRRRAGGAARAPRPVVHVALLAWAT
jgi:hypothetical protein